MKKQIAVEDYIIEIEMSRWDNRELTQSRIKFIIKQINNKIFSGDYDIYMDEDFSYLDDQDEKEIVIFHWKVIDLNEQIKQEQLKEDKVVSAYLFKGVCDEDYHGDVVHWYFNSKYEIPTTDPYIKWNFYSYCKISTNLINKVLK